MSQEQVERVNKLEQKINDLENKVKPDKAIQFEFVKEGINDNGKHTIYCLDCGYRGTNDKPFCPNGCNAPVKKEEYNLLEVPTVYRDEEEVEEDRIRSLPEHFSVHCTKCSKTTLLEFEPGKDWKCLCRQKSLTGHTYHHCTSCDKFWWGGRYDPCGRCQGRKQARFTSIQNPANIVKDQRTAKYHSEADEILYKKQREARERRKQEENLIFKNNELLTDIAASLKKLTKEAKE